MNKDDLIYVCSPLSAPTAEGIRENMKNAAHYARITAQVFHCRAIAPHSFLPRFLDDRIPEERELALSFGLSVLRLCKAMVICGNHISRGMKQEIRLARELNIPIIFYPDEEGINCKENEREVSA